MKIGTMTVSSLELQDADGCNFGKLVYDDEDGCFLLDINDKLLYNADELRDAAKVLDEANRKQRRR